MSPIKVIIDSDADELVKWGEDNEGVIHMIALDGVAEMLENKDVEELVLVEFYERTYDNFPFAEILLHQSEMLESLQVAQDWFVENEQYEEAARVKNYRDQIEYKQHE